jgi:F-type H+-transporting ATPase subunit b
MARPGSGSLVRPVGLVVRVGLVAVLAPVQAWASGGEAENPMEFVWELVNFLLLLGAIVYFARKPISQFFEDRRNEIGAELNSAAEILEQAEKRFGEWQQKMAELDGEIGQIRDRERQRAQQERARILEDARQAAERIKADAGNAAEREFRRAQTKLREEAAELAIELASKLLRDKVADADRDRLMDEFISRVEQTSLGAGSGS